MGPLLIQEANVVAHQLQDFCGIAATGAMAFNIDEPAQFISSWPT
jgi:hypothetical protein